MHLGYLLYLGYKQIKQAKKLHIEKTSSRAKPSLGYFREGFFLASTNPKPILFFTALFPQFLQLDGNITLQFFSMTFIFMALSFVSLLSYAAIFSRAKNLLSKGNTMVWFHRLTGGIFIAMSVLLMQLKTTNN